MYFILLSVKNVVYALHSAQFILGLIAAGTFTYKSSTVKPCMHVQYVLQSVYPRTNLVGVNKNAE